MNEEKIIEIAERYGRLENIDYGLAWVLSEDALRCFVQEIIEKETKEYTDLLARAIEVLRRQVNTTRKSGMTEEKIIEIANRYGSCEFGETIWFFSKEEILDFAQTLSEELFAVDGEARCLLRYGQN